MAYRDFGSTGLQVFEVGLGCGPLGSDPAADYAPLLERALELGVNFFDTADFYGGYRSEEWLGKVLSRRRDEVIIATKLGTVIEHGKARKDFTIAHMKRAVEESLRRLGTDYIDVYQLHNPPRAILDDQEVLAELRKLKEQGKIRFYGISLDGGEYGMEAIDKWGCDAIQILLNVFNHEPAERFLPYAKERGVGVIIKAPLDSGMLGGELMPGAPLKPGDPRERWGEESTARRQKLIAELNFLTEGTGRTWSQAALQFVLSFEGVSVVIPGTTSVKHLEEDVGAAGGRLTAEELARISRLQGGSLAKLNLGW